MRLQTVVPSALHLSEAKYYQRLPPLQNVSISTH
jgi:hypothetical protein